MPERGSLKLLHSPGAEEEENLKVEIIVNHTCLALYRWHFDLEEWLAILVSYSS